MEGKAASRVQNLQLMCVKTVQALKGSVHCYAAKKLMKRVEHNHGVEEGLLLVDGTGWFHQE